VSLATLLATVSTTAFVVSRGRHRSAFLSCGERRLRAAAVAFVVSAHLPAPWCGFLVANWPVSGRLPITYWNWSCCKARHPIVQFAGWWIQWRSMAFLARMAWAWMGQHARLHLLIHLLGNTGVIGIFFLTLLPGISAAAAGRRAAHYGLYRGRPCGNLLGASYLFRYQLGDSLLCRLAVAAALTPQRSRRSTATSPHAAQSHARGRLRPERGPR